MFKVEQLISEEEWVNMFVCAFVATCKQEGPRVLRAASAGLAVVRGGISCSVASLPPGNFLFLLVL